MNDLMKSNIYEADKRIIICGSCLKDMQPQAFVKLEKFQAKIFDVCMEQTHINMVITKVLGMIRAAKISEVIFVTVDKSPHCLQLHFIQNEIKKIGVKVITKNFVASEGQLIEITPETISLSKNLSKLQNIR